VKEPTPRLKLLLRGHALKEVSKVPPEFFGGPLKRPLYMSAVKEGIPPKRFLRGGKGDPLIPKRGGFQLSKTPGENLPFKRAICGALQGNLLFSKAQILPTDQ